MSSKYKRVLLKLSGEQLAGEHGNGIDPKVANFLAAEVKKAADSGVQVAIMVGAGNLIRGAQIEGHGIKRVTGDHMGMLATMINALALTDIFEHNGIRTRCLTNIFASQVAEPFVHRLAEKHLQKGRVVIIGGGIGRPYFTTDTAAVSLSLELSCDVVLKATQVDGVYDKDPKKHDGAVKHSTLTYQEAVESPEIKVMDKSAMALGMEQQMPIIVFDSMKPGNILAAASGEDIGTTIA